MGEKEKPSCTKPVFRRAGGPKVKTGCGTCKIRRVKCDEGRPICMQCKLRRLVCDGYVVGDDGRGNARIIGGHDSLVVRAASTLASIPTSFEKQIFKSDQEYQSFSAFEKSTSRQIFCAIPSELWSTTCLQISQADTSVYKAVLALGLMSTGLNEHRLYAQLDSSDCDQSASEHYGQALVHLRKALPANTVQAPTLHSTLCVILLLIFEFLRGNDENALTHLRAAASMIRSLTASTSSMTGSEQTALQQLREAHTVISVGISMWLSQPYAHTRTNEDFRHLYLRRRSMQCVGTFERLEDELTSLNHTLTNLQQQRVAAHENEIGRRRQSADSGVSDTKPSNVDGGGRPDANPLSVDGDVPDTNPSSADSDAPDPEPPSADLESLVVPQPMTMEILTAELDSILAHADVLATTSSGLNVQTRRRIFQVHGLLARQKLATLDAPLTAEDTSEDDYFTPALSLVEFILDNELEATEQIAAQSAARALGGELVGLLPLFNFVTVTIAPLFYIATRSTDVKIQDKALDLLDRRKGREGAWDSTAIAKIARRRVRDMRAQGKRSMLKASCSDTVSPSKGIPIKELVIDPELVYEGMRVLKGFWGHL